MERYEVSIVIEAPSRKKALEAVDAMLRTEDCIYSLKKYPKWKKCKVELDSLKAFFAWDKFYQCKHHREHGEIYNLVCFCEVKEGEPEACHKCKDFERLDDFKKYYLHP